MCTSPPTLSRMAPSPHTPARSLRLTPDLLAAVVNSVAEIMSIEQPQSALHDNCTARVSPTSMIIWLYPSMVRALRSSQRSTTRVCGSSVQSARLPPLRLRWPLARVHGAEGLRVPNGSRPICRSNKLVVDEDARHAEVEEGWIQNEPPVVEAKPGDARRPGRAATVIVIGCWHPSRPGRRRG